MVGFHSVDDGRAFLVFLQQPDTDFNMGSFHFVVDALADVMEQSGPPCKVRIRTQVMGQVRGQVGDFQGMFEDVLTVAGPVFQPADQFDQLRMDPADADFQKSLVSGFLDFLFNLQLRFLIGFFDSSRVDPAVVV